MGKAPHLTGRHLHIIESNYYTCERFVVDKMPLTEFFSLPVLQFSFVSIILQMLHTHISLIYNRCHYYKQCWKKQLLYNSCHYPGIYLEGLIKTMEKKSVLLQSKPTFKPATSQIQVSIIMSWANLLVNCFYHFDAVNFISVMLKYI
jgi:hypothetical protein